MCAGWSAPPRGAGNPSSGSSRGWRVGRETRRPRPPLLLGEAARGRRRATLGCDPLRAPSDATSVEGLEAMTTSRDDPRDPRAADVAPVPATRLPLARQIPDEEATTTNKRVSGGGSTGIKEQVLTRKRQQVLTKQAVAAKMVVAVLISEISVLVLGSFLAAVNKFIADRYSWNYTVCEYHVYEFFRVSIRSHLSCRQGYRLGLAVMVWISTYD
ncbi:uncharacterized protein LOC120645026 isoform X1 [Panicum virgatum]|uniref:Uncharacterized protein n=1 Tax=Panicum virgatum TaxID=38727 RepID=A0A8T0PRK4_PANVG|nr:uncharacterized protein LOC120645026 isoform X1 [Panicum virgatum]KAG2563568.1 hypothetical protein PVAP13_8KG327008 [Panicum virgatum]